jgi:hypothetical protein
MKNPVLPFFSSSLVVSVYFEKENIKSLIGRRLLRSLLMGPEKRGSQIALIHAGKEESI